MVVFSLQDGFTQPLQKGVLPQTLGKTPPPMFKTPSAGSTLSCPCIIYTFLGAI